MLDDRSRLLIIAISAACVAAAFAFAPLRARSSVGTGATFANAPIDAAAPFPTVAALPIVRDPFVGMPTSRSTPATRSNATGVHPTATSDDERPATDGVAPLPGNLAVDTIPAMPADNRAADTSADRVTAVVTGAHPYALLELGGRHLIVGIGDRVAGSRIESIDRDGVTLDNGARIGMRSEESIR